MSSGGMKKKEAMKGVKKKGKRMRRGIILKDKTRVLKERRNGV
jgi:hypothetical protein